MSKPYLFDEFFASGREEAISPFLIPSSRKWGKHLPLKNAFAAIVLLFFAFSVSFTYPPISFLLLCAVYFLVGTPALIGTIEDIQKGEINIDVLMTVAALLSVLIGSAMEGALLLVLFALSAAMEDSVSQKTRSSLFSLHKLSPASACVIGEEGILYKRSVKEIPPGTLLLVKAGEVVPLDGIVVSGRAFVNLVHLTGESEPAAKKPGDEVPSGGYTVDGSLTIRAVRTSSDSTLGRMIRLITEAQEAKPRLEKLLDRFGKWYALSIISLSMLFALLLPHLFSIPYLGKEGSIYRALAFLIAASPCALILATPTAYLSALSCCAKKGILLKGGAVLDALAICRRAAFDKTGTLTSGKLICTTDATDQEISIAAGLEQHAVHPIAEAILNLASRKNIKPAKIVDFKLHPGQGLEGAVGEIPVYIGNKEFIESKPSSSFPLPSTEQMTTFLLVRGALSAFHFVDAIRPEAKSSIAQLKNQMSLAMLTGDKLEIAKKVGKELGIDEVYAQLRPEEKLDIVSKLSSESGLIMVGDGVNDAPALARATVGISMGGIGSATAIDASDVVFLNDDLSLLPWLMQKAHQTMKIVKQNLTLALLVILLATIPAVSGLVPLWLAVILHEGGSVLVGLNSLRLLRAQNTKRKTQN